MLLPLARLFELPCKGNDSLNIRPLVVGCHSAKAAHDVSGKWSELCALHWQVKGVIEHIEGRMHELEQEKAELLEFQRLDKVSRMFGLNMYN